MNQPTHVSTRVVRAEGGRVPKGYALIHRLICLEHLVTARSHPHQRREFTQIKRCKNPKTSIIAFPSRSWQAFEEAVAKSASLAERARLRRKTPQGRIQGPTVFAPGKLQISKKNETDKSWCIINTDRFSTRLLSCNLGLAVQSLPRSHCFSSPYAQLISEHMTCITT